MRSFLKNFLIIFTVLLLVAGGLSLFRRETVKPEVIGVGKLVEEINAGAVENIIIEGDTLMVDLKDEKAVPQQVKKEPQESFGDIMKNYGVSDAARKDLQVEVKDESSWKFWAANIIPALLPLIIIIVFFYFMTKGVQGANNRAM